VRRPVTMEGKWESKGELVAGPRQMGIGNGDEWALDVKGGQAESRPPLLGLQSMRSTRIRHIRNDDETTKTTTGGRDSPR